MRRLIRRPVLLTFALSAFLTGLAALWHVWTEHDGTGPFHVHHHATPAKVLTGTVHDGR